VKSLGDGDLGEFVRGYGVRTESVVSMLGVCFSGLSL
jgi:hypothetical protein